MNQFKLKLVLVLLTIGAGCTPGGSDSEKRKLPPEATASLSTPSKELAFEGPSSQIAIRETQEPVAGELSLGVSQGADKLGLTLRVAGLSVDKNLSAKYDLGGAIENRNANQITAQLEGENYVSKEGSITIVQNAKELDGTFDALLVKLDGSREIAVNGTFHASMKGTCFKQGESRDRTGNGVSWTLDTEWSSKFCQQWTNWR